MKTLCRPLSAILAATLALMSACAVPVTLPPPAAAPTSPPVVKQLEQLVPTAVPQPTPAPVVVVPTAIPPSPAPTAVPPPPKPAGPQPLISPDQMKFEGKVDIGGRSLYLTCYGKGEPTVVMDGFLSYYGAEFLNVMPNLMKHSRACFYARPNAYKSLSDPVKTIRTSNDLAAELYALLGKAGLKPPYILAGSGFGALDLVLFAAQHPKEVAGLVFVDPQAPGTTQAFLDLVPKSATASVPEQKYRDFWEKFSQGIVPITEGLDPTVNVMIDVLGSEKQALEIKTLGNLPITVIRSQPSFGLAPDPAIWRKMEQITNDKMAFFAALSSRYETSTGKSVYVLGLETALFVDPIVKFVDAARLQRDAERAAAVLKIADSYLGPLTDQDKFGGAVLIAQDGKVLMNKGYGYADRDKKTAFTPDSQFLIPLVQPWPAAAVMMLQAQSEGKFSLDDSVCKFITPCLERYKPITLRNLLANTAGLPDVRYDKDVDAALNGVWFSLLNYHGLPDAKFGKPGEKFTTGTIANGVSVKADFGNWAWTYLAGTAALNLNKDLGGVYKDRIKNPLSLGSYGLLGYENDGKLVALYDGAKPAPYNRSLHTGAALMSAADLNTFVQALFDGRLLKPDQLAEMLKPTVKVDTMPGDMYAALGAYVGMDPAGNDLVAGAEVHQGFGAYWAYYPDSKLTVIVMNNVTDWANQPYRARDIGLLLARVILAAK